jgi:hypothetical protein
VRALVRNEASPAVLSVLLIEFRRDLFSVQGGADPSTKHQVYWNEYSDLDDSPVSWHVTEVSARYLSFSL